MASSQLIRQWTLLQELAVSYRGKTMEELGRLLEVGKRTARRDLEALEAAGFPVEKVRDGREVCYRLLRGHKPPQIPFDLSEALALYNAPLLSPLFPNAAPTTCFWNPRWSQAAERLAAPGARLRGPHEGSVQPPLANPPPLATAGRGAHILQEQAADSCRMRMRYENLRGEVKERPVDPYCLRIHLRGQSRVFPVDRVQDVVPLEEEFQAPPEFSSEDLLNSSLGVCLGKAGEAVLRFRDEVARYVLQRPLHPEQVIQEQSDAHVVIRVPVRGEREVIQAVLRFGALAEVLDPPELREATRAELQRMAQLYTPSE